MGLTILKELFELLDRVKKQSETIQRSFPDRTTRLCHRMERIEDLLHKIQEKADEKLMEDELETMLETCQEMEVFLLKLSKKSSYILERNRQKYETGFQNLNQKLNEDVLNLGLSLNAEVPLEKWDDPETYNNKKKNNNSNNNPPLYPPMLHQLPIENQPLPNLVDWVMADGVDRTPSDVDFDMKESVEMKPPLADAEPLASRMSDDEKKSENTLLVPTKDNIEPTVLDDDDLKGKGKQEEEKGKREEEDPVVESDPHWVAWDTHRVPKAINEGWSSNSSRSLRDRQVLCHQIRKLRHLHPSTPVSKIRVVVARLEPGDTTAPIMAAQIAGGVLGAVFGAIATPMIFHKYNKEGQSVSKSATKAIALPGISLATSVASLKHFLLQIEFGRPTTTTTRTTPEIEEEGGGCCVMERCDDDVYLYYGRSSRQEQRTVLEMIPTRKIVLRDLILLRNKLRQNPYELRENDCQTFTWDVLTALEETDTLSVDNRSYKGLFLEDAVAPIDRGVFLQLCYGHYMYRRSGELFRPQG